MNMDVHAVKPSTRGKNWFNALTTDFTKHENYIQSVAVADGQIAQPRRDRLRWSVPRAFQARYRLHAVCAARQWPAFPPKGTA